MIPADFEERLCDVLSHLFVQLRPTPELVSAVQELVTSEAEWAIFAGVWDAPNGGSSA